MERPSSLSVWVNATEGTPTEMHEDSARKHRDATAKRKRFTALNKAARIDDFDTRALNKKPMGANKLKKSTLVNRVKRAAVVQLTAREDARPYRALVFRE